jgi:hypothetical protein
MQRRETLILIFILAIGIFIRFSNLTRTSLWMDEIWSIEISTGRGSMHDTLPTDKIQANQPDLTTLTSAPPWWNVRTTFNLVIHPPLYHIVLRWWMDGFGNSTAAVRALSAIFSAATIFFFFDLLRLLHGRSIAFSGAAIMTLAGAQLDAAQEARSYAMLLLIAVASADALIRIEKSGPSSKRLIALGLSLLAGLLTHYLVGGLAAAFALYSLIRMRGFTRRKTLFAIAGSIIFFTLIWGSSLVWQSRHLPGPTPSYLLESLPDRHVELTARRIIGLPGEYLLGEPVADKIFRQQTPIDELLTILLLALAVLTLIIPWARLRSRPELLLWMLWIAGTIGLVAAADLVRGTTMTGYIRYTLLAAPCIYVLIAACNWPQRELFRNGLARAVIVGLLILTVYRRHDPPEPKENWRDAAARLDSLAAKNDLIIFYNQDPWVAPGMWYMCLHYYSPQSTRPWLLLRDQPDQLLREQINAQNSLWLVTLNAPATAEFLLPGWQLQTVIPISTELNLCQLSHPQ